MKLLKLLLGTLLTFSLFCPVTYAGQITRTLSENTRITPPGVIVANRAEIPVFKKGTVVTLNEFGEILEGTLAEDVSLTYESGNYQNSIRSTAIIPSPQPPVFIPVPAPASPPIFIPYVGNTTTTPLIRVLSFKGGTKVVFNDKGEVIRGTVTSNQNIYLNPGNHIGVSGAEIAFHKNGMVAACTIAKNTYLRPVGWSEILTDNFNEKVACPGFVEFKAGKPIELNDKGEVVKGTLNNDTKLNSVLTFSTVKKLYKAETIVEFDDKGIVIKAQEPNA